MGVYEVIHAYGKEEQVYSMFYHHATGLLFALSAYA